MESALLGAGIACIVGAIVGGGLKAFGMELPVVHSPLRQLALAGVGVVLLVVSRIPPSAGAPAVTQQAPAVTQQAAAVTQQASGSTIAPASNQQAPAPAPASRSAGNAQALMVDGAASVATIDKPGQTLRFTFDGTVGQRLTLQVSDLTFELIGFTFLRPDGGIFHQEDLREAALIRPAPLPLTGTYTIALDAGTTVGSVTLALISTPDVVGNLVPDGPPVNITIGKVGQRARVTFDGVVGQRISLKVADITMYLIGVKFLKPDGTTLYESGLYGASGDDVVRPPVLPSDGTYTIVVDSGEYVGSATLALFKLP